MWPMGEIIRFPKSIRSAMSPHSQPGWARREALPLTNNSIGKINSGGTLSTFVSADLSGPGGLAFDNSGYLYVANSTGANIKKVDTSGTVSSFATSVGFPVGIAFGASGNLFASNNSSATPNILEITTAGSSSIFGTGTLGLSYMAFAPVIVPEPSSFVLAALASGVLWMMARKRSALS